MKRTYLLGSLLLLCCCTWQIAYAQVEASKPMYTSSWGHLLSSAEDKLSVIGVFCTEALVVVLDSTTTHYKVQMRNQDVGYIERQPLSQAMHGKSSPGEPRQYFDRGAEGAQGPHLYVQASELRVRNTPSLDGKAVRKVKVNDYISLDYIPLDKDGWVSIGNHLYGGPEYIQAKFLGPELTYEQVLKDYLAVKGTDLKQERVLAGRLREMGWQRGGEELKTALQYWNESMGPNAGLDARVDIDLEILLANRMLDRQQDYTAYSRQIEGLNMHYLVHGVHLEDGKITQQQLQPLGLKKVADIPNSPECGWEPKYFYKSDSLIVAFEENVKAKIVGSMYRLDFNEDVALVLGKQHLNSTYTERSFIEQFGHLLDVDWIDNPHVYRIGNGDAGYYAITFKNGFPVRFECVYYC